MARPRTYPLNAPTSVRMNASNRRLAERNGARKSFRLEATALSALQGLVALSPTTISENAVVNEVLIEAFSRKKEEISS